MTSLSILPGVKLQDLIDLLLKDGYEVLGPTRGSDAIVYTPITHVDQLPKGLIETQSGGSYRLRRAPDDDRLSGALFAHVVGPHSWKRYLFPPREKLWSAVRQAKGFSLEEEKEPSCKTALLGVRACELAAIRIQDSVFQGGEFRDRGYVARRGNTLLVAVDCQRAGETCFCSSTQTGPGVDGDCDIALTEFADPQDHHFLARGASDQGWRLLNRLQLEEGTDTDSERRSEMVREVADSMGRHLPENARELLADNPEHPHWDDVAGRCLNCGSCTMVCPTCFCSTVEDVTTLDGSSTARWRQWDSCFTVDFSFIHGGSIRRAAPARYRHWITHKLSHWYEQFGSSGCTGCGRCITWCPVGIDITREVRALGDTTNAETGGR